MATETENVGKHLFEISSGGFAYYRGVVQGETEKTFMTLYPRDRRARRCMKGKLDILLDASVDPEAATNAFRVAYDSFRDEFRSAQEALSEISRRRREAGVAALKSTTP